MAGALLAAIRRGHASTAVLADDSLRSELESHRRQHPELIAALLLLLGSRPKAPRSAVSPTVTAGKVANDFAVRIDFALPRRKALADAYAEIEYRIDTVASTEAAQVFNAARADAVADLGDVASSYEVELWKTWEAVLDGHECSECRGRDGETVRAWQLFPGDQPGYVHPRCRCFDSIEPRAIEQRIAA